MSRRANFAPWVIQCGAGQVIDGFQPSAERDSADTVKTGTSAAPGIKPLNRAECGTSPGTFPDTCSRSHLLYGRFCEVQPTAQDARRGENHLPIASGVETLLSCHPYTGTLGIRPTGPNHTPHRTGSKGCFRLAMVALYGLVTALLPRGWFATEAAWTFLRNGADSCPRPHKAWSGAPQNASRRRPNGWDRHHVGRHRPMSACALPASTTRRRRGTLGPAFGRTPSGPVPGCGDPDTGPEAVWTAFVLSAARRGGADGG